MTRTKKSSSKDPEGHAVRAQLTQRKKTQNTAKRRRQEVAGSSQEPSAKKAKTTVESSVPISEARTNEQVIEPAAERNLSDPPVPEKLDNASDSNSITLPPGLEELKAAHEVITISIVSSSNIWQKVTRALNFLSLQPVPTSSKPKVIVLHSKAKTASKMITVAEITKRELAQKGGTWFQYNYIGQIVQERTEKKNVQKGDKVDAKSSDGNEADGLEGESDGEDGMDFESMKTPFERAIEGRPKIRVMPTMSIYLARERINNLRIAHG